MKNLLFLIAFFFVITTNAQNYLISFAGTGTSLTVNSVKVENLTANTSLTLNGSEILRLTGTVGISQIETKQSEMKIYPNPMFDNATVEISPPLTGNATISVYDITGKQVAQIQSYLENYPQEFRLSGLNRGLYLISVKGNNYQYSGKLLCNGEEYGTINIEKISSNQAADVKTEKKDYKGTQVTLDMPYTTGDRLKFTGISGIYRTVIMDIPASDKTITFNFIVCTDGDNNNYPIVEIGTQVWMAENLKTTKYNLGTDIPYKPDAVDWIAMSSPAFCWYNNDEVANKNIYGALYNWYAASNINLCPTGWHVPTEPDWSTLTTYLGGLNSAGGKMKETGNTHWISPNTGATNSSGFTGLPGGWRSSSSGTYNEIGVCGEFWSNTISANTFPFSFYLDYYYTRIYYETNYQAVGFSVRCLKN